MDQLLQYHWAGVASKQACSQSSGQDLDLRFHLCLGYKKFVLLVGQKSSCSRADSPEECRGKLVSWLMTGMLGKEGLLTRFLSVVPTLDLHALLVLEEMECAPLTCSGPKSAETDKHLVSRMLDRVDCRLENG